MRLRTAILVVPVALGLLLAGCMSDADKAAAYEAQYDRLMALQAYPAALKSIQKAISYDESSSRRYIKLGEIQETMGNLVAAAGAFQQALDLEPDNIEALERLAILSIQGRQFDVAKRYIDPLLALSANDPAGLFASGAIALNQHRFQDAVGLADQVIAGIPDRPDGYILKARGLDGLGKTREAIDMLEKRAAVADDPKELLFQLMAFYRRLGDTRGIRATAIRMMPLYPNDPRYAIESARAYAAEGKQDKVSEIVDDLLRRFARNPDVLIAIGNFWHDTEPQDVARAKIVKLAAGSPPRVRSALADQLIDLGDPRDALDLLGSMAPAQVTSDNIDSQTHYARALLAAGQVAQAKAKVAAVLGFDRANPEALLVRAHLKLLAKDYRGALTDAQVVARDDETNEEAALLVARIYAAQGNQVLAASAFGTARQQFPNSTDALKAETDWLVSQNRGEEAAQRASSFFATHRRSGPAMQILHDVCRKTRAGACGPQAPSITRMLAL
jgi:tetratricopeptide (TPR) repeat protein